MYKNKILVDLKHIVNYRKKIIIYIYINLRLSLKTTYDFKIKKKSLEDVYNICSLIILNHNYRFWIFPFFNNKCHKYYIQFFYFTMMKL
jgi:hypothetical protein